MSFVRGLSRWCRRSDRKTHLRKEVFCYWFDKPQVHPKIATAPGAGGAEKDDQE
jgi:hypothetical protein